mmetsp:Transcript_11609/g.34140  ORF Transcript_11609/g.34140 Transcript_11609/m.34140 type:complete len:200 (-) Transcript_11609:117-716(-)
MLHTPVFMAANRRVATTDSAATAPLCRARRPTRPRPTRPLHKAPNCRATVRSCRATRRARRRLVQPQQERIGWQRCPQARMQAPAAAAARLRQTAPPLPSPRSWPAARRWIRAGRITGAQSIGPCRAIAPRAARRCPRSRAARRPTSATAATPAAKCPAARASRARGLRRAASTARGSPTRTRRRLRAARRRRGLRGGC